MIDFDKVIRKNINGVDFVYASDFDALLAAYKEALKRPTINKELMAITKKPIVQSLLYDLDLLPEQLMSQQEVTPGLVRAYYRLDGILMTLKAMELYEEAMQGRAK